MLKHGKMGVLFGLSLMVLMGWSQVVQGDNMSISIRSDKATMVSAYAKDTNLGSYERIEICSVDNRMGLVQWDLSGIPSNANIINATLKFYGSSYMNAGGTGAMNVYQVTAAWDENTVTWNNRPAISTLLGTVPYVDGTTTQFQLNSENLKTLVQNWVNGTTNNYGVFLNQNNSGLIDIGSDDASEANRPLLEVTYEAVPEPATLALLGSGLFLGLIKRRRTR